MKAFCSIFLLLFLTLNQMEARKSPEDYWKLAMGEEPIPEAIAGLVDSNQEGRDPVIRTNGGDSSRMVEGINWDHWIKRDFDTRSVAIIYHHRDSRVVPHGVQVDHHGDDAS